MFLRIVRILVVLGCAFALLGQIIALLDLYSFEFGPIMELLGPVGITVLILIDAAIVAALWLLLVRSSPRARRQWIALLIIGALAFLWCADWMFVSTPITSRLLGSRDAGTSTDYSDDFRRFSVAHGASPESQRALWVAYQRILLNNPESYARHPIGQTIDTYATRYSVNATLIFYLNYIDSFYGEAVSGRMPFTRAMTGETARDVVQGHLPSWFIENPLRLYLIRSTFFPKLAGEGLGFKLRYAVHKATLDVSSQPYALNTYSDIFLVMKEYPDEFKDVLQSDNSNAVRAALRDSFVAIRDKALQKPYEFPARVTALDDAYYDAHRSDLKKFARASYYMVALDFDFATRVQALLTAYQARYFRERMGAETWDTLPQWQQLAMLAMIRDLYEPGVGQLGYDLYAIPEINCTPLEFVAAAARDELGANASVHASALAKIWRPAHSELLWAGAAYRLRVFNEIWNHAQGAPIPGLPVETSIDDARAVVARHPYSAEHAP